MAETHDTVGNCRLRVWPAPEHLGEGAMLELSMAHLPGDDRRAEVYLDPESKAWLLERLTDG